MVAILLAVAAHALYDSPSFFVKLFQNNDPPITKAMFEALREPTPLTHDSVTVTVHRAEVTHKK